MQCSDVAGGMLEGARSPTVKNESRCDMASNVVKQHRKEVCMGAASAAATSALPREGLQRLHGSASMVDP